MVYYIRELKVIKSVKSIFFVIFCQGGYHQKFSDKTLSYNNMTHILQKKFKNIYNKRRITP